MPEKCKYCGTSFFKIITKTATYISDGKKETHEWTGCVNCWNLLQVIG